MVSLGFIRSFEQCPPEVRQVRVLRSEQLLSGSACGPAYGLSEATVRIWHDDQGLTRWGLDWSVRSTATPAQWVPLLATRISKLGWNRWWLDVSCLARAMNLSPDKALDAWGEHFWKAYSAEALVLLDVGQQRRSVYQVVRHWEQRFPLVSFSSRHDYDDYLLMNP